MLDPGRSLRCERSHCRMCVGAKSFDSTEDLPQLPLDRGDLSVPGVLEQIFGATTTIKFDILSVKNIYLMTDDSSYSSPMEHLCTLID